MDEPTERWATCKRCVWWDQYVIKDAPAVSANTGQCRVGPPWMRMGRMQGDWPTTLSSQWCGSFDSGKGYDERGGMYEDPSDPERGVIRHKPVSDYDH